MRVGGAALVPLLLVAGASLFCTSVQGELGTSFVQGPVAAGLLAADASRQQALLSSLVHKRRKWEDVERALATDPGVRYDTAHDKLVFSCGHAQPAAATAVSGPAAAATAAAPDAPLKAASAAVVGVKAARAAKSKCPLLDNPSSAFQQHSRPSSPNKILLDFTGHTTVGTAWNLGRAGSIITPPYSWDADPAFSADELAAVLTVFRGVAEDFSGFDVDITTQEDGLANPTLRVVLGGTGDWIGFGGGAGAAYAGAYVNTTYQPVFVFTGAGSLFVPKLAWESASHYIGHALGLLHKGVPGRSMYTGQGAWAPIMGLPFYKNVTQWSNGDYPNASNTDDELAIISATLPFLPSPTGPVSSAAAPLPFSTGPDQMSRGAAFAVLSRPTKTHYYSFLAPVAGIANITAVPAPAWCASWGSVGQADLDIRLDVLRGDTGLVVATSDPDGALDASVVLNVTAGTYVVAVSAVGAAAGGYSDYGSLGAYTLTAAWPAAVLPPPKKQRAPRKPGKSPPPTSPAPALQQGGVNSTLSPRLVIVPGITLCNVQGVSFYAWLRDRLQRKPPLYLDVTLRKMPDCAGARESYWIPFMRNELRCAEDTVIVGHSSGAIAAMRFAQRYKVAGIVLVATYETSLGLASEKRSEYFDTPWDWDAIKANAGFIIQFASTTDPFLGLNRGLKGGWQEQMDVAKKLDSELHIVARGHFLGRKYPEIADAIEAKLMGYNRR